MNKIKKILIKHNRKINIFKNIFKISFFSISIYALQYQFDLPLFIKLAIIYAINEYFLKKI